MTVHTAVVALLVLGIGVVVNKAMRTSPRNPHSAAPLFGAELEYLDPWSPPVRGQGRTSPSEWSFAEGVFDRWSSAGRLVGLVQRSLGRLHSSNQHDVVGEVEKLKAQLASGTSLGVAVASLSRSAGPWAKSAARVARQLHTGRGQREVLDLWAASSDDSVRLVVDSLAIASSTGASEVRALDASIRTLRQRDALRREVKALSSQAFMSCVMLVATPIVFSILVAIADPRVFAFYTGSVLGAMCVVLGLGLNAAGAWWMVRQVRSIR